MKRLFDTLVLSIPKYAFAFFIVLYSVLNILFTVRQYNVLDFVETYHFGITVQHIIIVIVELLLIYAIVKHKPKNLSNYKFLILFLVNSLVIGIYWIFSNHPILIELDDAYNCFRAARLVIEGDYGPLGYRSYINTYPHNLPLVTYFMIFVKLFGDSATTVIRLVNLGFILVGYTYLYKITDYLYKNERVNTIMICMMFLSMQFVFHCFFIYGNAISYSLGMVSAYYFLKYFKEDSLKSLVISMLTIVVSIAIKNNSLIILVAEFIFLFVKFIEKKDLKIIVISLITILLYLTCTTGVITFWEKRSGNDYSNKLPRMCWIAYGLNYDERHPGGYMNEFEVYHQENGFVPEFTEIRAEEFIDGVLNAFAERPYLVPKFYIQKFLVSFANPDYEAFGQYSQLPLTVFNESLVRGSLNDVVNEIWDGTSTIISIGLLSWYIFNRKKLILNHLFLGVIVFGGFVFHAIWETKAIYLYQYYLLLLPYAAKGLSDLFEKLKGKLKHD